MIKVCKFGGTSTADAITLLRMKKIVEQDPSRRYVVVSAPGRRYGGDKKITDLLYEAHTSVSETGSCGSFFLRVRERFRCIVHTLGLALDIEGLLDETEAEILRRKREAFTASRGEYLVGKIAAELLGIPFLDAEKVILFRGGRLDERETDRRISEALKEMGRAVIPGFYGSDGREIKTLSRGGSDVTGALVARAVKADLYENWTDVSGFYVCDPRIADSPESIRQITYRELRELSYMGASVLHEEAVFPVRAAGIPILVKNTFRPEDAGTEIVALSPARRRAVTGIAGRKHFALLRAEKKLMERDPGFVGRILVLFEERGLFLEHMSSGVDRVSFVLRGKADEALLSELEEVASPDCLTLKRDISLIAVVGQGMERPETTARLLEALARIGVRLRLIDLGASELSVVVGVDDCDLERSLRALYEEFFK